MIKKEIYPKTRRISCTGELVEITEKIDGSNLCIFKYEDEMFIAQRKTILSFNELEENKGVLYKGLYDWIQDNKEELNLIRDKSVICGEWIGMGKLKYSVDEFDKRFYMFAKANIDEDFDLYNIFYYHSLFQYPFENLEIPKCIGVVPMAYEIEYVPDKDKLDILYEKYVNKVNRNVEGFVININNSIKKYVRMKNGKLQEHHDSGE